MSIDSNNKNFWLIFCMSVKFQSSNYFYVFYKTTVLWWTGNVFKNSENKTKSWPFPIDSLRSANPMNSGPMASFYSWRNCHFKRLGAALRVPRWPGLAWSYSGPPDCGKWAFQGALARAESNAILQLLPAASFVLGFSSKIEEAGGERAGPSQEGGCRDEKEFPPLGAGFYVSVARGFQSRRRKSCFHCLSWTQVYTGSETRAPQNRPLGPGTLNWLNSHHSGNSFLWTEFCWMMGKHVNFQSALETWNRCGGTQNLQFILACCLLICKLSFYFQKNEKYENKKAPQTPRDNFKILLEIY